MKTPSKLAITTLALVAVLGIGNAIAQSWPMPSQSCGPQNAGETTDVYYYNRRTGENLQITYYCDGSNWQLFQVCDLNPHGVCEAY